MRRHMLRSASTVLPLALAAVLALWSCSGDTATQPNQANELVVVTEPKGTLASPGQASSFDLTGPGVSYVSLVPGSEPRGDSVEVRNIDTGELIGAPMVDGGFDPIPITASVGDELEITVFSSGVVFMRRRVPVPAERPPRVVRTDPAHGRTRVPLNSVIVITPTEPLDPGTVTTQTVRLLQNGVPVVATVSLSSDGLRVEVIPERQLQPGTAYAISVSTAVRDAAGDPFALEYTSDFTTTVPGIYQLIPVSLDTVVGNGDVVLMLRFQIKSMNGLMVLPVEVDFAAIQSSVRPSTYVHRHPGSRTQATVHWTIPASVHQATLHACARPASGSCQLGLVHIWNR